MPTASLAKTGLIAIDDYLAGELESDTKYEYLGGYVYAMAGASNIHNRIATSGLLALGNQLRGKPCEPFNSDTKVRVRMSRHTRFYYPDNMVVCNPNPARDSFQDNPVVITEVISDATRRIDEGEKLEAYLNIPSLMAYLLVETNEPFVRVHRRTDNGFVVEVYQGLNEIIPLDFLDAKLPLKELYERVDFKNQEAQE